MSNTRFKDFGSGLDQDKPALSFRLHDEDFKCVREVQGKVLIDLVAKSKDKDPAVVASIITDFFDAVLEEESLERFNFLLVDKNRVVTMETLTNITEWLVEEYSARPTVGPEVS